MHQQFAETTRYILREIVHDDLEGMYELDSNPEVHKYLGDHPVKDKNQIVAIINYIRQQYISNGIGRWAVEEKATGNFVGWAGLKLEDITTNNHTNYFDLGYRLIPKYWGQGIATECSIAALQYGFDVMKINTIYGAAHVDNIGSNKVLQRVGLKFVESFYYEDMKCNWYRIDR